MTLQHWYDGTLLTNRVQLAEENGISIRAALGEAETIRVIVDDPGLNLTIEPYQTWRMVETDCPVGQQTIWRGLTTVRRISRGTGRTTFPAGRRWEVELVEDNWRLGRRAITGLSAKRPAETVDARLTWLLTTPSYSGVIYDRGLVEFSGVLLDPVDYTGRSGADVLRDLGTASGYNFFVRYREATDDLEIAFRDDDASERDISSLQISNDPVDIDLATTWPAGYEATLEQSPARIASEIILPYTGGTVVRASAATEAKYGAISLVAPTSQVKTAAAATVLADRLLGQHATEDERIPNMRLRLPAANVNDVRAGQLVRAKLSHAPGFSSFRPCRVLGKSVSRPPNLSQDQYDVDLELSPAGVVEQIMTFTNGWAGWTTGATFPHPVSAGNLLVVVASKGDDVGGGFPLTVYWGPYGGYPPGSRGAIELAHADIETGSVYGPAHVRISYMALTGVEGNNFYIQANSMVITMYELRGVTAAGAQTLSRTDYSPGFPSATKSLGNFPDTSGRGIQIAGFELVDPTTPHTVAPGWIKDVETSPEGAPWSHGVAMHGSGHAPVTVEGPYARWAGVAVDLVRLT